MPVSFIVNLTQLPGKREPQLKNGPGQIGLECGSVTDRKRVGSRHPRQGGAWLCCGGG